MAVLLPNGKQSFFDSAGAPLNGGKVYTYSAGTNVPLQTWADAAGTVPNTNPVILDSRGEALIYWEGSYKVKLTTSLDGLIWTVDNIQTLDTIFTLPNGSAVVGFIQNSLSAVAETVQSKLRLLPVNPEDFGCVGNGAADDTAKLNSATTFLSSIGGGILLGRPGANYRLTNTLDVWPNIDFDLNGATLTHDLGTLGVEAIYMRDNTCIRNGTTSVLAGIPVSVSTQYHANVVTGRSLSPPVGSNNVLIQNLTVYNAREDAIGGTGILVFGGSTNVLVENIYGPSSATLSGLVRVFWCGDGAAPNPLISAHPGNVIVRNIRGGTMTKAVNGTGDVAFVDIASVYNVTVENVTLDAWYGDAVLQIRAGAFGSAVAPASVKEKFLRGIKVRGVSCAYTINRLIAVNGNAHGAGTIPQAQYSIPVEIREFVSRGAGAASLSAGVEITLTSDVVLGDFEISAHYRGIFIQESTSRITVERAKIHENWHEGVAVVNGTTPPERIMLREIFSYANGQGGTDGKGFYLEACNLVTFQDCTAGVVGEATQTVGFSIANSATRTTFRGRNPVLGVPGGGVTYDFAGPVRGDITLFGGSGVNLPNAGTHYNPVEGFADSATEAVVSLITEDDLIITNLTAVLSAAPGAGAARVFTLRSGGADTSLVATITVADTSSQSFNAVRVPAGTMIAIASNVGAGVPAAAAGKWSLQAFRAE